jgi:hypothetical protein
VPAASLFAALALAIAGSAPAALPARGVLVPGRTLGGLAIGATRPQVRAVWGTDFGRCRGCRDETWYYTYHRFAPQGAAVTFEGGRVVALFTIWSPQGWRTSRGLQVGDAAARVTELYGALPRVACGAYTAVVQTRPATTTAFYLVGDKVWGFGLSRAGAPVCR